MHLQHGSAIPPPLQNTACWAARDPRGLSSQEGRVTARGEGTVTPGLASQRHLHLRPHNGHTPGIGPFLVCPPVS